jgi:hypothetical protein
MPAHRQSALLLHGLNKADQHWILARLADDDRRIVGHHLAELKELGIPADPGIAAQASGARAHAAAGPLHAASGEAMFQLLADEPVWLVRHVLALADWPWRTAFLDAHGGARRERLAAASPAPLAPLAAERLLARLAAKLALPAAGAHAPAVARANPLALLRGALRRWA